MERGIDSSNALEKVAGLVEIRIHGTDPATRRWKETC
jgi:hypothetical protein